MKKKNTLLKKYLVISIIFIIIIYNSLIIFAKKDILDIDEGIYNLNYNKNEVLASEGDKIDSFVGKEGIYINDKFFVIERNKKSLNKSPIDISITESIGNRTYPGVLQLADLDFVDNKPNILACKRKPINISIDLPGLKEENTIRVENPNYGSVNAAIGQLIDNWSKKYSKTHSLPARIQYSESMVHSKSQIASALNMHNNSISEILDINYDSIEKGEKKVMLAAYKQIFYNVNAETPNNPSDLFSDDLTFKDLELRGVSDRRPPLMVSNVSYGRVIYVKLETTSKSKDVERAFKSLIHNTDIGANHTYDDIFEESSFTAVVLGGDSKSHNKIITKDFEDIRSIIKDNSEFSLKNPAYPISYTSTFLKDNSIAAIHNNTEYIETLVKEYKSGKMNINHRGGYVAQFNIEWDDLSFDQEGNEILEHRSWSENWKDKTAPFTSVIYLPANARNIQVYSRACTALAWDWWRTIIDEYNIPLASEINISIGGTSLAPTASIEYN